MEEEEKEGKKRNEDALKKIKLTNGHIFRSLI